MLVYHAHGFEEGNAAQIYWYSLLGLRSRKMSVEASTLTKLAEDYKKDGLLGKKLPIFVNMEGMLVESPSVGEGGSDQKKTIPSPAQRFETFVQRIIPI